MFEIGFWELALLFVLGLVVLGPEKLPKVARQLGHYTGQARRMARTLTNQLRDEWDAAERAAEAAARDVKANMDPELNADLAALDAAPATEVFSRPGMDELIPRAVDESANASTAVDTPDRKSSAA